jgi:uncharacterized protein
MNLKPIIHRILEDYALPWHGVHGVGHWARVLENGLRLAKEARAKFRPPDLPPGALRFVEVSPGRVRRKS